MRNSRATPIQKMENIRAVMRERARVPSAKDAKSARGQKDRRS